MLCVAAQHFTKIASEKTEQAKDAASKVKDKSTGTGKSAYDSVAANLQSAKDKSAKQLEDTRAAADQQWVKLQKVNISQSITCGDSLLQKYGSAFWTHMLHITERPTGHPRARSRAIRLDRIKYQVFQP